MEDRKKQLFDEHLPYELEMFEEAARFLMSDECARLDRENNKDDWFRANAAVEAFWTHARTLKEFFTQRKNPEPVQDAHHASAQDFAPDYWNDLELNAVIDKINAQVSHLNYGRESAPPGKLSHEMQFVKAAIDKQVRRFQEKLAAAATKNGHPDQVWHMAPRRTVEFIPIADNVCSTATWSSASFTSILPGRQR
jgi:hypothetical protein